MRGAMARGWLWSVPFVALGAGVGMAPAVQAEVPAAIQAALGEEMAACRDAGGTPTPVDGYLMAVGDLDGDGGADFVTDLAALQCANAWSYFCGSAGCPVTVWLSGAGGHSPAWRGYAQTWELRDGQVVLHLHGQMCNPPRPGVEGCEVALHLR